MEILISAHEQLIEALEDIETKRVAQRKFEKLEHEHSDALKQLNQKIAERKEEGQSLISSVTASSRRSSKASHGAKSHSSKGSRASAIIDRKKDTAVKVAKLKTELNFANDEAAKIAELKKLRLTKELAMAEVEMKAIDQVEETQLEFTEGSEDMVCENLIEDSCKDDLLQNYLESQALSVTERSISTVETNLSGKSKIVLQKPISKVSETVNSCQDKQNEGLEGNVEPSVQRPSSLNPFAPDYVAFSTPKNAQSAIYPSDFLLHCQSAMKEIKYLKALNDPEENQKMLCKLPRHLADRWMREVDRWLNKEEQVSSDTSARPTRSAAYPPFSAFCEFLKKESRIACNPVTSLKTKEEGERKEELQRRGRFTGNNTNKSLGAGGFATEADEVKDSSLERKED